MSDFKRFQVVPRSDPEAAVGAHWYRLPLYGFDDLPGAEDKARAMVAEVNAPFAVCELRSVVRPTTEIERVGEPENAEAVFVPMGAAPGELLVAGVTFVEALRAMPPGRSGWVWRDFFSDRPLPGAQERRKARTKHYVDLQGRVKHVGDGLCSYADFVAADWCAEER